MRILFYLTRYPGIGGIENVTSIIISQLQKNHDISIISHAHDTKVNPIGQVRLFFMPNSRIWTAKENMKFAEEIMEEYNFEAIVYQDSYAPTDKIVCHLAKKYFVPLYVFEHNSPLFVYNKLDLDPITTMKGFLRRLLHPYILYKEIHRKRRLLNHAKKYILLSKQFIPEFCKLVGIHINDDRITYINNPILPINMDVKIVKENIILCVSRLVHEKCVDKVLEIWDMLYEKLPEWKLVIVGDGSERSNLEKIVSDNKIQRVEFTGFTNPILYYQKAKIFWMTSKFEGWGMTLIEAMQYGCVPIVFQTFSSVKDIVVSGGNGFLIKPNDIEDFQGKTLELANNENMRVYMEKQSVQKVQKFSVNKIIHQWEILLNQK